MTALKFISHPILALAVYDHNRHQLHILFRSNGRTNYVYDKVDPNTMAVLHRLPVSETWPFLKELEKHGHSMGYNKFSFMPDQVFEDRLFGINPGA